jgi:hypothetical protein
MRTLLFAIAIIAAIVTGTALGPTRVQALTVAVPGGPSVSMNAYKFFDRAICPCRFYYWAGRSWRPVCHVVSYHRHKPVRRTHRKVWAVRTPWHRW